MLLVRTNGEGWFRMHPPMHALYHLPNLVSHPTPRPTSKPTQWRTWGSKPGANPHSGWLSAARFAPDFSGPVFAQVCMPPHCPATTQLSIAMLDTIMKHCSMPLTTPHFVFHACHRLSHGIPHYSISHACHSHLPHAHDMRFTACHSCTCPSLTCLQCVRRFSGDDL